MSALVVSAPQQQQQQQRIVFIFLCAGGTHGSPLQAAHTKKKYKIVFFKRKIKMENI